MNDRFRFRAWYQPSWEEHRMLYDVEQTYDFMRGEPESVPADCFGEVLEDSKFIVMQCTGLKDKNGKLIYEGDIVNVFHLSSTMQARKFKDLVYFNKKYPSFQLKENGFIQEDDLVEIIGNIYENKELLNEQI